MDDDVLGGRYTLGPLLGRGGMADVHRAHDEVLGRDVAVKLFRDAGADDPRQVGEVRMLAGLSHPHLVTVFDAGEDGGRAYLVLELVPGATLRERLTRSRLTPDETATLGAGLAGALAYVHQRGIVHRDVKPANVLLTEDGTAKLTDFGVARLLDSTHLTVEGTTLGTPNYLSPEQTTGGDVAGPSDIYSLGLVLLECLTGAVAFPGHGVEAAVARLHRDPAVPADLPAPWPGLLTAMTARAAADRPSAAAVADTLRGERTVVLTTPTATLPLTAAPTEAIALAPAEDERRKRRGLPILIGAVVAAIVALGITAASLGSGTDGSPTTPSTSVSPPPAMESASSSRSVSSSAPKKTSSAPASSSTAKKTTSSAPSKQHKPKKTKPPKGPGGGPGNGPGGPGGPKKP